MLAGVLAVAALHTTAVPVQAQPPKNVKIAVQLGISINTLFIHQANVKRKLNAKTAVDVARAIYAKKFGVHRQ